MSPPSPSAQGRYIPEPSSSFLHAARASSDEKMSVVKIRRMSTTHSVTQSVWWPERSCKIRELTRQEATYTAHAATLSRHWDPNLSQRDPIIDHLLRKFYLTFRRRVSWDAGDPFEKERFLYDMCHYLGVRWGFQEMEEHTSKHGREYRGSWTSEQISVVFDPSFCRCLRPEPTRGIKHQIPSYNMK